MVWVCHATRGLWKTSISTSLVYAMSRGTLKEERNKRRLLVSRCLRDEEVSCGSPWSVARGAFKCIQHNISDWVELSWPESTDGWPDSSFPSKEQEAQHARQRLMNIAMTFAIAFESSYSALSLSSFSIYLFWPFHNFSLMNPSALSSVFGRCSQPFCDVSFW